MIAAFLALLACVPPRTVEAPRPAEPRTYVGTAACGACHASAAAVWVSTGHARAHATLTAAQHGFDPECLACHVTAAGVVDDVGCEACHGPGSGHVAAAGASYGALPSGATACIGCHTQDNSPDFTRSGYWPRIAHGR